MNTDRTDLQIIGGIQLFLLFAAEIFVIIQPGEVSIAPLLIIFLITWIMTPIILSNLECYKLWFWALSAFEWAMLPLIVFIWLPEYEYEETSVHIWVLGGSIIIGMLIAGFSAFMARARYLKMTEEKREDNVKATDI